MVALGVLRVLVLDMGRVLVFGVTLSLEVVGMGAPKVILMKVLEITVLLRVCVVA